MQQSKLESRLPTSTTFDPFFPHSLRVVRLNFSEDSLVDTTRFVEVYLNENNVSSYIPFNILLKFSAKMSIASQFTLNVMCELCSYFFVSGTFGLYNYTWGNGNGNGLIWFILSLE